MKHFADFGYVRAANKRLKREIDINQAKKAYRESPRAYSGSLGDNEILGLYRYRNKINPAKLDSYTTNPKIYGNDRTMLRGENRGVQADYGDSYRQLDAVGDKTIPQKPPMRKPKSSEELEVYNRRIKGEPDFNSFTEVRANSDPAIEASHLGFRKDPFKGYGGMMEEPVDLLPSTRRLPKARIRY